MASLMENRCNDCKAALALTVRSLAGRSQRRLQVLCAMFALVLSAGCSQEDLPSATEAVGGDELRQRPAADDPNERIRELHSLAGIGDQFERGANYRRLGRMNHHWFGRKLATHWKTR